MDDETESKIIKFRNGVNFLKITENIELINNEEKYVEFLLEIE